ncbi:MAG TPA: hypothetical protein VJV79_00445 [Polyangiaceae bacterium]|nr:hypothetical protein [Polyangiaceae bacterium]
MRLAHHHVAIALTTLSTVAYLAYYPTRTPLAGPRLPAKAQPLAVEQSAPLSPAERAPSTVPATQPVAAAPAHAFDERGLMSELRALRLSDPEQALLRAMRANSEHPGSADAAERAWIAVRSLDDLRRFHEAQDVAREMQRRYPGTSWTEDVERHVLLHPLDFPSREEQQARLAQDPAP